MSALHGGESRVAVLVDCDNTSPAIIDYALRMVAQLGRVVIRRGYGNHATLGNRWQEAMVRLAFTPHLQYQYASGKNTADIALALDAMEVMFDHRADTFCLVTSDSDFAYLCRKLRERGATVCIVGETKTPAALRNASDNFFEWPGLTAGAAPQSHEGRSGQLPPAEQPALPSSDNTQVSCPEFVLEAIKLLTDTALEGKVTLSSLGAYLKRTDPSFAPGNYGYAGLLDMLKNCGGALVLKKEDGGHHTVRISPTVAVKA